jgi:glycosyltransferase involved in cell wall biosynthesis
VIAGNGPELERLRKIAAGSSNVIFPGWLNGEELSGLLHISQIGLIAFKPVPNYLKNIPNKFPEYLASGMAVACGLGGEMARLTEEFECGFVYAAGNVDDFCANLVPLLGDKDRLRGMQENASALHAKRFDSSAVYPAFADYLEKVAVEQIKDVNKNDNG